MTREQIYTDQLQELGVYDPAFAPEIRTLAQLERRLARVQKAWAASAPAGGKPSFLDPHYPLIVQLEDKILLHREALGLTPKSLRRLKGAYYETVRFKDQDETQEPDPEKVTVLDLVREKYAL